MTRHLKFEPRSTHPITVNPEESQIGYVLRFPQVSDSPSMSY